MDLRDHAEDMAKDAIGNWRKFESFGWHDEPTDSANWAIVYTHNRDSSTLERANASSIDEAMSPFCTGEDDADAQEEHHGHWACGWIDGYAIRVRNADGELTAAWLAWCELAIALEDYPVLDEDKFSEMEHEDENESWESYGRRDFLCALRKDLECYDDVSDDEIERIGDLYEDADASTIDRAWHALCEKSGRYAEHESDGVSFPIGENVGRMTWEWHVDLMSAILTANEKSFNLSTLVAIDEVYAPLRAQV